MLFDKLKDRKEKGYKRDLEDQQGKGILLKAPRSCQNEDSLKKSYKLACRIHDNGVSKKATIENVFVTHGTSIWRRLFGISNKDFLNAINLRQFVLVFQRMPSFAHSCLLANAVSGDCVLNQQIQV